MTCNHSTVGMLRQLFAEMPEDKVFTAKQLADLFEKVSPLFTPDQEKLFQEHFKNIIKRKIK